MTTDVATVGPDTSLGDVAKTMHESRFSCIVVVDNDMPLSVITERDMTRVAADLLSNHPPPTLREVMSKHLITLNVQSSCDKAVKLANEKKIRRLVVVYDNGKLAGLATQSDLLRAHAKDLEFQKSYLEDAVNERTLELQEANKRLTELSRIDPMLGVGNRRSMDEELIKITERTRRYQCPFSIALVDVDHFKKYNDHYGHQMGDDALIQVAKVLSSSTRCTDSVYRYGGEEFLVILPDVTAKGAAIAAKHMRTAVESLAIEHQLADNGVLTASFGVAEVCIDKPNICELISMADEALYEAKQLGRNCVSVANLNLQGNEAA